MIQGGHFSTAAARHHRRQSEKKNRPAPGAFRYFRNPKPAGQEVQGRGMDVPKPRNRGHYTRSNGVVTIGSDEKPSS